MKRRLKINGVIISAVTLLITFFPRIFFRNMGTNLYDEAMEILGVTFILLGQILRVSARGYKSEYSQNGHALIQGGPYAAVRNPMYLGILLIGLGIVLVLFNWWVVIIFLSVFITRYLLLMFREEKRLKILFPQAYRDYSKKVPRLLPSVATLLKKDISEYLPFKLLWLKREIGPILVVLFITVFVESWEEITNQSVKVYFIEAAEIMLVALLFICLICYLNWRTARLKEDAPTKNKSN